MTTTLGHAVGATSAVGAASQQFQELTSDQIQSRLRLFTGDLVEMPREIRVSRAESIRLPTFDPSDRSETQSLFSTLKAEHQATLLQVSHRLVNSLASSASGMEASELAAGGVPEQVQTDFITAAEQYMDITGENDANEVMQGVMTTAISTAEAEVYDLAMQLKGNLDAKAAKREEIADFQTQINDHEWGDDPMEKKSFDLGYDENGQPVVAEMTRAEADSHLEKLDGEYQTIGDMTQMMQMQLQDAMNKQAQAVQMMSAIMKSIHDTLKAIIANMRA